MLFFLKVDLLYFTYNTFNILIYLEKIIVNTRISVCLNPLFPRKRVVLVGSELKEKTTIFYLKIKSLRSIDSESLLSIARKRSFKLTHGPVPHIFWYISYIVLRNFIYKVQPWTMFATKYVSFCSLQKKGLKFTIQLIDLFVTGSAFYLSFLHSNKSSSCLEYKFITHVSFLCHHYF